LDELGALAARRFRATKRPELQDQHHRRRRATSMRTRWAAWEYSSWCATVAVTP
jgi:hypothetical protein